MATDLYKDFVFARLVASLDNSTATFTVDSVDQLPNNAALATGDFWMTLESTLIHPPTFEIVKLTAVDSGLVQVTVLRGQDGTTAVAHDPGTFLKGSLTAAMLGRLAARVRASASATTGSLAPGGQATLNLPLAVGFRLLSLTVNRKARIRLYATSAYRTADLARAFGTDPTGDHGVILDYRINATPLTRTLSPVVDGASLESTPSANIPMTVDNVDSSTGTITVTATWIRTE